MMTATATDQRPAGRPRKPPGAPTHRPMTEQIRYADSKKWVRALNHADLALGQPMTVFVTIQWKLAPSAMPEPERVSDLLNSLGGWLRYRTGRPAVWAYSREAGERKGVHLHLMVNVPDDLFDDFALAVNRWVEARAVSFLPKAVDVRPITQQTFKTLRGYHLKEGDARTVNNYVDLKKHRADARNIPVAGKRLGFSHAIGPEAQRRHAQPNI